MNELIQQLLSDFEIEGQSIPVKFLTYKGDANTYITYMNAFADNSYSADDEILGYVDYYDFDIYTKADLKVNENRINYFQIIKELKRILEANDFTYQPSKCSADRYEADTGFYHKTVCFAYMKGEING